MLALIKDLIEHKAFANASMLNAVAMHDGASRDLELRKLLHHIILANRFWLYLTLHLPFDVEEESRIPDSLDDLKRTYEQTHNREIEWISNADESELTRELSSPLIPVSSCSVAEAMMQVCMHSHGHRAQIAARLRQSGGTPPAMDFILWLKDRPPAQWR